MTVAALDGVPVGAFVTVAGVALGAGVAVTALAAGFRWYFRQRVPVGVALLVAATVVTLDLNTRVALGQAVAGSDDALAPVVVGFNLAAFAAAVAVVAPARRVGDRVGVQLLAATGTRELTGDVGSFVKTVGRAIAVDLPADIDDIEGYDPVGPDVKRDLSGKTLIFPRKLTVDQLRERLVTRLKDDYEVGYVDAELDADGTVTYLALGRRTAGLGPTLPPGTAAVAVRANPPNAAGAGDLVQVYETGGDRPQRVTTAEIRGVHEDAVTLALDDVDASDVAGGDYRLVTLPYEPGADRQFATLLRGSDETLAVAEIAAGSDLDGATVGDVPGTVVAVRSATGVAAIPDHDRALAAGDTVYAVARPDAARRLDAAAAARSDGSGPATD